MEHYKRKELNRMAFEYAAMELFATKSYDDITMDEIAQEAKLTKTTLYKHFPSKLALVTHIFESHLEELYMIMVKQLADSINAADVLTKLAMVLYDFTLANYKFMLLFWNLGELEKGSNIPDDLFVKINAWNKMQFDYAITMLEKFEITGIYAGYSPTKLVHFVSAVNKGIFVHTDKEIKVNLKKYETKELHDLFIDVLRKGLGA